MVREEVSTLILILLNYLGRCLGDVFIMIFREPRKESVYIDPGSVYFENGRLSGSMRQRVAFSSKDKHRAFLRCQTEIADVRENLNKLLAFREAVGNITIVQLTSKKYNYRMPNINNANESAKAYLTNKTRSRREQCGLHTKRGQTTGNAKQLFHNSRPSSLQSGQISSLLPAMRTSAGMDLIKPFTPFSKLTAFPEKAFILEPYNLERKKTASLEKSNVSCKQKSTLVLNKSASSTKEQWAGLGDALSPKINSSAATARPRFRRMCTAVSSSKFSEALSLRRLRELYILDESKYVMSAQRQANFMRYLLVLNRKQNRYLQAKVRNFLDELG